MIPYAAEIYPVQLRGTGSGVIAASSKFGGILGAAVGVAGLFEHFELSALLIALPMAASASMLLRSGIETRGQRLEDIQRSEEHKSELQSLMRTSYAVFCLKKTPTHNTH